MKMEIRKMIPFRVSTGPFPTSYFLFDDYKSTSSGRNREPRQKNILHGKTNTFLVSLKI